MKMLKLAENNIAEFVSVEQKKVVGVVSDSECWLCLLQ